MIFMKISLIPIVLDLPSVAHLAQVFSIALVGQTETFLNMSKRRPGCLCGARRVGRPSKASLYRERLEEAIRSRKCPSWRALRWPTRRRLASHRCTTEETRQGFAGGGKAHAAGQVLPTQKEEDEDETRE